MSCLLCEVDKDVALSTITVNWRGCCEGDCGTLEGFATLSDLKIISIRALSGTAARVRAFFATAGEFV